MAKPELKIEDVQWEDTDYGKQAKAIGIVEAVSWEEQPGKAPYANIRFDVGGSVLWAKQYLTPKARAATHKVFEEVFGFVGTIGQFKEACKDGRWHGLVLDLLLVQEEFKNKVSVKVRFIKLPKPSNEPAGGFGDDQPFAEEPTSTQDEQPAHAQGFGPTPSDVTDKPDDDLPY